VGKVRTWWRRRRRRHRRRSARADNCWSAQSSANDIARNNCAGVLRTFTRRRRLLLLSVVVVKHEYGRKYVHAYSRPVRTRGTRQFVRISRTTIVFPRPIFSRRPGRRSFRYRRSALIVARRRTHGPPLLQNPNHYRYPSNTVRRLHRQHTSTALRQTRTYIVCVLGSG